MTRGEPRLATEQAADGRPISGRRPRLRPRSEGSLRGAGIRLRATARPVETLTPYSTVVAF